MYYLLIFILLLSLELFYFKLADRYNIIDKPNQRSSHTAITLRGGGIIFYISVAVFFVLNHFEYPWFFAGLSLISFISFMDDIKPQSSKLRLGIHFISMFLIFVQWNLYTLPWYYSILALILCTGILNAYNFMDGINGITGFYSLITLITLWYINNFAVEFIDNEFIYTLGLGLVVFNLFNFRKKAKCFAGDIGSISIAFTLIFLIGKLIIASTDIAYIVILVVYGVDAGLTIVHRLKLKENIFNPHRKHVYQIMANELKIPHLAVSALYGLLQLIISAGLVIFFEQKYVYIVVVASILSISYFAFKKKYYHLHKP